MKKKSNLPFFYLTLLSSLTADALLSFIVPVLVYAYTLDIGMSGLAYGIEWLVRLMVVPVIGRKIDTMGIRPCAIFFDSLKIVACLGFIGCLSSIDNYLTLAVVAGIFGSLVALSNAQTLIVYEKYISEITDEHDGRLERYANFISRADQLAMILGPLIGFFVYGIGIEVAVYLAIPLILLNLYFFISRRYLHAYTINAVAAPVISETENPTKSPLSVMMSSGLFAVLLLIVIASFFSNMLDGTVEAAGVAVIFSNMNLPMSYFAFINIAAGLVGVMATFVFSRLYRKETEVFMLTLVVILEFIAGLGLFLCFEKFSGFILCYALCIGSKILRITLTRIYRIRLIPKQSFASLSSIMTVMGQSSLPLVGLLLYISKQLTLRPEYIIVVAAFMVLTCYVFLIQRWQLKPHAIEQHLHHEEKIKT
ncbi:MAG: hypothetical protein ACO2ZM_09940 [Francisellaceae bacterium]